MGSRWDSGTTWWLSGAETTSSPSGRTSFALWWAGYFRRPWSYDSSLTWLSSSKREWNSFRYTSKIKYSKEPNRASWFPQTPTTSSIRLSTMNWSQSTRDPWPSRLNSAKFKRRCNLSGGSFYTTRRPHLLVKGSFSITKRFLMGPSRKLMVSYCHSTSL